MRVDICASVYVCVFKCVVGMCVFLCKLVFLTDPFCFGYFDIFRWLSL